MKRPLDVPAALQHRNGVTPSFLIVPTDVGTRSVLEYLLQRFHKLPADKLTEKIYNGGFFLDSGEPALPDAPIERAQRIWYFREVHNESSIPYPLPTLYEDDHIIVVDKPHFLATTPAGSWLHETALIRLRAASHNLDITAAHRLDRATAGVLLFTKRAELRRPYQQLFEQRQTQKIYQAVCVLNPKLTESFDIDLRLKLNDHNPLMSVVDGEPNSQTHVQLLAQSGNYAHYQLTPETGKQHQLRIHMAHMGAGIVNDPWYPNAQLRHDDNFAEPLQLLAQRLAFIDPVTGQERCFESQQTLHYVNTYF